MHEDHKKIDADVDRQSGIHLFFLIFFCLTDFPFFCQQERKKHKKDRNTRQTERYQRKNERKKERKKICFEDSQRAPTLCVSELLAGNEMNRTCYAAVARWCERLRQRKTRVCVITRGQRVLYVCVGETERERERERERESVFVFREREREGECWFECEYERVHVCMYV